MTNIDESSFGSAFAAARKSGLSTFEFGGKSFNTRKAGESTSQWKSSLKPASSAPVPRPRSERPAPKPVQGPPRPPVASSSSTGTAPKKPVQGPPRPSTASSSSSGTAPKKPVQGPTRPPTASSSAPNPRARLARSVIDSKKSPEAKKPVSGLKVPSTPNLAQAVQKKAKEVALKNADSYVKNPKYAHNDAAKSAADVAAERIRKKLKTEDYIPELSTGYVSKYKRKANDSLGDIVSDVFGRDPVARDKAVSKEKTREKGIDMADKKLGKASGAKVLAKEETIVESSRAKLRSYIDAVKNKGEIEKRQGKYRLALKKIAGEDGVVKGTPSKIKEEAVTDIEEGKTWKGGDYKSAAAKKLRQKQQKGANDRAKSKRVIEEVNIEEEQDGVYRAKVAAKKRFNHMVGHEHKGVNVWNDGKKSSPITSKNPTGKAANGKYKLRVVGEGTNWKGDLGHSSTKQYDQAKLAHPTVVGHYSHPDHPGKKFELRTDAGGDRHVLLNTSDKDIHGGFGGGTARVHKALTSDFDNFKKAKPHPTGRGGKGGVSEEVETSVEESRTYRSGEGNVKSLRSIGKIAANRRREKTKELDVLASPRHGKVYAKEEAELDEGKTFRDSDEGSYSSAKSIRDKIKKFANTRKSKDAKKKIEEDLYPEVRTLGKKKAQ